MALSVICIIDGSVAKACPCGQLAVSRRVSSSMMVS
ncbi:Uncharacterised protein [Mycobacterium tuberculosis]|nr:Uncharacterised protein [Mycobacterium tuberculosis]